MDVAIVSGIREKGMRRKSLLDVTIVPPLSVSLNAIYQLV